MLVLFYDVVSPVPWRLLSLSLFDTARLRRLRTAVLRWYARHGRDLPWRENRDPYRIWISEAMLQQTTVTAVKPYFARFLARFPTVEALAEAPIEDVLRQWEGLGYYSRARNLHRAAQVIVQEHGGVFPPNVDVLHDLPGVGRYTAGAIASFAYDIRAPIVEANTLRLYCRMLGYDGDPRSKAGQTLLWEFAETILPTREAGAFNHAVMDLGATVCRPSDPDCANCPLTSCCEAFARGTQDSIPQKAKRPELTDVIDATVVVRSSDRVLIRRRGPDERWAGLWDYPRLTLEDAVGARDDVLHRVSRDALTGWLKEQTGLAVRDWEHVADIRHGVTRYRIRLLCFLARAASTKSFPERDDLRWITAAELEATPLSMTGRKLTKLIASRQSTLF